MPPSADEESQALSTASYWDARYAKSDGSNPTHEWFKSFTALEPFLQTHLLSAKTGRDRDSRILHLGSGDSTIPYDLARCGFRNQLCVDFSPVVVRLMEGRNESGVEWLQADVRDMNSIGDRSIDVAFDKGTLDAMIYGSPWDPPDEVKDNTSRYINEVCLIHSIVQYIYLVLTSRRYFVYSRTKAYSSTSPSDNHTSSSHY